MPNDYTDPKLRFPRLEVQIWTIKNEVYFVDVWLRHRPGNFRHRVMTNEQAGSFEEAQKLVRKCAAQYHAFVDPDDITTSW
jgi:hypothetical protein